MTESNPNPHPPPQNTIQCQSQFVSFGYRCTTAGILKKMGLKLESFPFDWLISRLSVIQHCIEDDFQMFLNTEYYEKRITYTYEMMNKNTGFICDEHILFHHFYQPIDRKNEVNTYCYHLAMNHHNIFEEKDREYYIRCIQRFRQILNSSEKRIFIHIAPLIENLDFIEQRNRILSEYYQFTEFIETYTSNRWSGIYFIMVRREGAFSYEVIDDNNIHSNTRYYILYVNPGLQDAGEIFYGNFTEEYQFIRAVIYSYQHIIH
jgi:hypothetical protein